MQSSFERSNSFNRDRRMQQLQSTSPNHNKGIGMDIASEDHLCQIFNGMGMGMGMGSGIGIGSEDLLCEIFFRLPPISLVRFKYVSKSWYSLISNLDFLLCYWNYNNGNDTKQRRIDLLLLGTSPKPANVINSALSIFRLNLPMPIIHKDDQPYLHLKFNNSCNGLLLYHSFILHPNYSCYRTSLMSSVYYVCNPLTKNYIKLPKIELKNMDEKDEYKSVVNTTKACIVFDPSVSLSYKVIRCCERISCDEYNESYRYDHILYVYSPETGSWRLLTRLNGRFNFGFRTALLNGVFYWYTDVGDICLCFDVEKENVWFLSLPMKPKTHRICLYFGECGGRLHLIEKYCDMDPDYDMSYISFPYNFDIMEMEQIQEDEKQYIWKVKYHVNVNPGIDHLIRKLESPRSLVSIVHLYRTTTDTKKEEEALLMHIYSMDLVVSFNLTSNTFGDEVTIIPNIKHTSKLRGVVPYTPTLFPVHQ